MLLPMKIGEWTCNGKIIKGGSRKTVLQQARINHSTVKKELKVLGVVRTKSRTCHTLLFFHQPIELENNLSATNRSWLHITDSEHFIESWMTSLVLTPTLPHSESLNLRKLST